MGGGGSVAQAAGRDPHNPAQRRRSASHPNLHLSRSSTPARHRTFFLFTRAIVSTGVPHRRASDADAPGATADATTPANARRRRVRFSAHDLCCHTPPKVTLPGSEVMQGRIIAALAALVAAQQPMLAPLAVDADADFAAGCGLALAAVRGTLEMMAKEEGVSRDMRTSARFYAVELTRFAEGEPLLRWRLQELLSSSLRYHLSAIFAEAEGDDQITTIKLKVLEHVTRSCRHLTLTPTRHPSLPSLSKPLFLHRALLSPGARAGCGARHRDHLKRLDRGLRRRREQRAAGDHPRDSTPTSTSHPST